MRSRLWAAALLVAACKNGNPNCNPSQALTSQALRAHGGTAVELTWNDTLQRPKFVHGSFSVAATSPEEAARAFLRRYAADFHLAEDGADLSLLQARHGKVGTYLRFQGQVSGLPVFDSFVIVHVLGREGAFEVRDLNLAHAELPTRPSLGTARLGEAEAVTLAERAAGLAEGTSVPAVQLGVLAEEGGARLAYRIGLTHASPLASYEITLDAKSGEVLGARSRLVSATGTGQVFDPNPVAATGNTNFTDNNDADSTGLTNARVSVSLPRLDGTGQLKGPFVDVRVASGTRTTSQTLSFNFTRSARGFEETMAYFHLDRVQARIQQELGFTDVNNRVQVIFVDSFDDANAFYDPGTREIHMGLGGPGGVDTGEDADVFVHEYGHSIQDNQVPGFGGGDEGAMGEGFSDYLATSMLDTLTVDAGRPQQNDPECLGEWFMETFGGGCLRRVDGLKHFPEDFAGEVHDDGEMWAAALFNARGELGADLMDTIVLESHFLLSNNESFFDAAQAILVADQNLFGGQHVTTIRKHLVEQGVSRDLATPANLSTVAQTISTVVENPRTNNLYVNNLDNSQTISQPGAQGIRLRFAQLDTELDPSCLNGACDHVYLYDGEGRLYQILSGTQTNLVSVVIPGDTVRVRLVTDGSVQKFGYRIDRIELMSNGGGNVCGDGNAAGAEACDGADLNGQSCTALGFDGGALSCNTNCSINTNACTNNNPTCGNGAIDAGEDCDGQNLGGADCTDLGFDGGALSCNANCAFNTNACANDPGAVCGNGVLEEGEECDGADLGGRGCDALGLADGTLACAANCTLDASACLLPECTF